MQMMTSTASAEEIQTVQPVRLLLTIPEAAKALGVCRSVIYTLMLGGDLPNMKIGRSRRIPVVALEDFVARQLSKQHAE